MTDALFQSQGAPYGDFKSPGTSYQGTIVSLGQVQSRKFVPPAQRQAGKQGELEWWPDSTPANPKPKMTAIVTVQTSLRDPNVEDDDGQRSVWIKGKNMTEAVKAAIRKAGASRRGLEVGGYFSMTFTFQDAEPEFEGGTPAKHYEVEYRVPEQNGQAQPTQVVAPPAVQPQPPTPAAPVGPGGVDLSNLSPEAAAALQAMLAQQGGQQ